VNAAVRSNPRRQARQTATPIGQVGETAFYVIAVAQHLFGEGGHRILRELNRTQPSGLRRP